MQKNQTMRFIDEKGYRELGEGPMFSSQISRNGGRVFNMLRGLHSEYRGINSSRDDYNDADEYKLRTNYNNIGKNIEQRLNGFGKEEALETIITQDTVTRNSARTDVINYNNVPDNYIPNKTVQQHQNLPNYTNNNQTIINTTMKNDDLDLSDIFGPSDNTVFINMDKTNKEILKTNLKICKILGLFMQLEKKNTEKICQSLDNVIKSIEKNASQSDDYTTYETENDYCVESDDIDESILDD